MGRQQRRRFTLAGQVQGVGFRPFVFRLAREHGLSGTVGNSPEGVVMEVQGAASSLDAFARDLTAKLPPLANISARREEALPPLAGESGFRILHSSGTGRAAGHEVLISPDISSCEACLADTGDPANRRHEYAFTNCTNCGPRYTITRSIPYDRAATSMRCFPMCPRCRSEYENPLDRRFHAQPNACPACGPKLWTARPGDAAASPDAAGYAGQTDTRAILAVAETLHAGKIAAIKGLGGFHLACDATNAQAVSALRKRKQRPHKALAVMCPDMDAVRSIVRLSPEEEALLRCPERPIVVCGRPYGLLAPDIAPDNATLGVMLPYTPLHHVLFMYFSALRPPDLPIALVMTSGNAGGEPICLGNREALRRLAGIADMFLFHDRDILIRVDDSVARPPAAPGGHGLVYRRARGYVPRPLRLGAKGPCVLGAGAELKSTLCVTRGEWAFVGQHVGDLQHPGCLDFYRELAEHLPAVLQAAPEAVICDLHPDYLSTRFARESGLPAHALQHHFAHVWSVLAEHRVEGPALGLALDGTGYGEDGTVWGGELLFVDTQTLQQRRLGRLSPFALPGGEAAIREPWRIAQGFLETLGEGREHAWPWLDGSATAERAAAATAELVRRGAHCPQTSSCGRLFDAVSALLGLCLRISYEGQAAVRLETAHNRDAGGPLELDFPLRERSGLWELDTHALMSALIRERMLGRDTGALAWAFHANLARGFADMALAAARRTGVWRIGLSGGVLQNATLAALLPGLLKTRGITPLMHKDIPAHDGGISLGQAAWGRRLFK